VKVFLCWLLAVSLSQFAPLSLAEVSERLDYVSYSAKTEASRPLLESLDAASPIRRNGRVHHGYTDWYVRWQFRWWEEADGRCRITSVQTSLTGKIQLPRLEGKSSPQFDRYLWALRTHELGHFRLGQVAAAEIDMEILALPEAPSCKALESLANSTGHRILNFYRGEELDYDASTDHGKSQGAWLKP
jgi:predicted secreted Zn-dependent protease